MAEPLYVVMAEIGIAKGGYGPDVRFSEPMTGPEVQSFVDDALSGRGSEFFKMPADALVIQVDQADQHVTGQYLVVEKHRLLPDRLSRLTVGLLRS